MNTDRLYDETIDYTFTAIAAAAGAGPQNYMIEFFAGAMVHGGVAGPAAQFLGSVTATLAALTTESFTAGFSLPMDASLLSDEDVTATVTAPDGSTSAFALAAVSPVSPFIVTNSSDTPIGPSGGNQVGGSTVGSLRLAITDANLIPNTPIGFDGQHGPYTIRPADNLPPILHQTTINGIDPNGATSSPFVTIVSSGGAFDGLVLQAGSDKSVIEGLSIEGFGGVGIDLMSGNDTIGGTAPGAGNVLFGNLQGGVLIESSGNLLQQNIIEGNGVGASSGQFDGIDIRGSSNTIGGNVISGNQGDGILIESSASSNLVEGNLIGTDANGSMPRGQWGRRDRHPGVFQSHRRSVCRGRQYDLGQLA